MHALSAADTMNLWERARGLRRAERAVAMLSAALPERTPEELAHLPLGQRDALLLELRVATFGSELDCFTVCPVCGEKLEFSASCLELGGEPSGAAGSQPVRVEKSGFSLTWRPPNSLDAAAISSCENTEEARRTLLSRCVLGARGPDGAVEAEELPASVQTVLVETAGECDPQAEIMIDMSCPACGQSWQSLFDIVQFLWTEIRSRARSLLLEVDALARAYGWREADILALSDAKRAVYLEMVLR